MWEIQGGEVAVTTVLCYAGAMMSAGGGGESVYDGGVFK
jgi:hypothetical protein